MLTKMNGMNYVESLHENGFTVIKNGFDKSEADECILEYTRQIKEWGEHAEAYRKKNGMMMRLANFHIINNTLQKTFVNASSLIDLCTTFFSGRKPCLYTSLFFNSGTQQPIHRDSPLFCTYPENQFLGCWFAFEDADANNGALIVNPKCHKLFADEFPKRNEMLNRFRGRESLLGSIPNPSPQQSTVGFSESELWVDYQAYVQERCADLESETQVINAEKGDIIVWHPLLPHGGSLVQDTSRTRFSCVFHVVPERERIYGNNLFFSPHEFRADESEVKAIDISERVSMQIHDCAFMVENDD